MSALKKLQMIGSKPYLGYVKLSIGFHEIISFRLVKNKFAPAGDHENKKSILVELKEEIVFLPQYFKDCLGEEDINDLNSANETQYLYFGGKREGNK